MTCCCSHQPMETREDSTSVAPKEPTSLSSSAGSKQDSGSKSATSKKSNSDSKSKSGGILDLIGDVAGSAPSLSGDSNTTSLHGSHVYDQHCDICTGKASSSSSSSSLMTPPPTTSDSPPQGSCTPSPPQHSPEPELMDTDRYV